MDTDKAKFMEKLKRSRGIGAFTLIELLVVIAIIAMLAALDWVLIDSPSGDDSGARGEPPWFKAQQGYVPDDQPGQLFNVQEDLSERKNHFAQRPNLVRELKELRERYQREGRSSPGEPQKNDPPRAARAGKAKSQARPASE